jgi:hypothetical protein
LKVAKITQTKIKHHLENGVPGDSWWHWFQNKHPNLTIKQAMGLDVIKA